MYYLAFEKKLTGVNRFIIGSREVHFMDEILEMFCQKAGVKKPRVLPKWVAYGPGFFMEALWTILHKEEPPLITRGRVNMFVDNVVFSSAKAKRLLGYESTTSLSEGVERTVNWYKANGYL